ncbi:hypothetical protein BDF20DRAFT_833051 [Mycotypha africana]|uniref:uncharacterized protein n=1 Tax=Mycotypha africana TaxID=64632 RepID=UPI002301BAF1|nr:uncharacterized protein BDF20DRAFT_833051 [Mycotypha africana]KAI8988177.1 hypothetical protein BDF20DRAFT_833051 [Mycotypha africana]
MKKSSTLPKKKKIPCEECRDQKRKCNGEKPCERCHKFNLCCVYTSTRSPRDEEFIELARKQALLAQIETMNDQMKEMESLMWEMKHSNNSFKSNNSATSATFANSLPSLTDDSDKSVSSQEDDNSAICNASVDTYSYSYPNKRTKLLCSSDKNDISAYVTSNTEVTAIKTPYKPLNSPIFTTASLDASISQQQQQREQQQQQKQQDKPWLLTFKRGNLCIETNVKTHSELLDNLRRMMQTTHLSTEIPPMLAFSVKHNTLIGVLNDLVRKRYGKTHCKNVARSVQIFVIPDISNVDTLTVSRAPDSIQVTALKLIRAYLRCQHLQQLAIHARTFIRLFMDSGSTIDQSPAAMALCAAICTMRCKHIAECLPSISLVEYGKFYFERARDLLSDRFDQFDLETLTCYTFMTIYKMTMLHTEEASLYADMAERIACILDPFYSNILTQKQQKKLQYHPDTPEGKNFSLKIGEAVHFIRTRNHLHRIQTYDQISHATDPNKNINFIEQDLPYCTLIHMSEGRWEIADDDSIQEKWFAQMHKYILQLQRAEHAASRTAQSYDLHHLIGLVSHQVEMAMRHWYYKVLPPEFKLSLPLFDSTVSCQEFFTTLERETAHSAIPVLTTLTLYEEWLVLAQSYLPKQTPLPENDWRLLTEVWPSGSSVVNITNRKWKRRVQKLIDLRKIIDFEGTDQEYLDTINRLLCPREEKINSTVILYAIHAALNTVRLIKYLRSRSGDCYFDIRTLISAWQMLLTVSKLQQMMPSEVLEFIPRIHKNLNVCMAIVKEELQFQPYQGKVGDYVAEMERELKSQVVNNDACDCIACPGL